MSDKDTIENILATLQIIKENAEAAEAALQLREKKSIAYALELLEITKRVEKAVGANLTSKEVLEAIQDLEKRIKAKIIVEDRRNAALEKLQDNKD